MRRRLPTFDPGGAAHCQQRHPCCHRRRSDSRGASFWFWISTRLWYTHRFKPMPTFGSYIFNFMSKPEPDSDFILNIEVGSAAFKVHSRKRPGVDEFLERVSKHYEVIVFTASLPQYANPLLDLLDPKGHITARLFRHHCTFQEGYFIKDLTRLRNNKNLMNTIIVDNSPIAYKFQPENAIDCTTWLGDPLDVELHLIADFLETVKDVNDVREYVEYWREGAEVLNPRPASG
eukprot:TRINITY_DN1565_c0_g1_i1.p1 TRINITY_DN1565_c0_g1~~TRINITY_DN1565_c0_g1_i1.p1  ORF type:complete len:232 (-),score=29.07 TRINITY_DN1565_c0_g1_i1:534-1229(-)